MTISNIDDQYLKLTSESITDFLANIDDYTQVIVGGTYNCITPASSSTETVDAFEENSWKFELANAVAGNEVISNLMVVNNATGAETNALTDNIDLAYVNDNCTATPCLIATHAAYFEPLFLAPLQVLFPSATFTITFTGNNMYIDGLPDGYSFKEISFVSSATPLPALYSNVDSETADFFVGHDAIYVKPSLFDQTVLLDGIYAITLKLQKIDGYVLESNCFFVDILTKCRVAAYLVSLIAESKSKTEQTATTVHMLHYGLTNGSNCGCNCAEMCEIYLELDRILTAFKLTIDTDCEC